MTVRSSIFYVTEMSVLHSKPLLAQLMRLYVCAPEGVPMSLRPIIVYRGNMIDLTANDAINLGKSNC